MGRAGRNGDECDSDDSVVHVPYTKPKPPEITIVDSDEEVSAQAKAKRRLSVSSNQIVSVVDVKASPKKKKKKKSPAKPNGSKENLKKKKVLEKKKKKKQVKGKKDSTVKNLFVPDAMLIANVGGDSNDVNKSGNDGITRPGKSSKRAPASAAASSAPKTNTSKKSKVDASATCSSKTVNSKVSAGTQDASVEKMPPQKAPRKRKKSTEMLDPEQAAALDHYRFLVSLNLATPPLLGESPKRKRQKKRSLSEGVDATGGSGDAGVPAPASTVLENDAQGTSSAVENHVRRASEVPISKASNDQPKEMSTNDTISDGFAKNPEERETIQKTKEKTVPLPNSGQNFRTDRSTSTTCLNAEKKLPPVPLDKAFFSAADETSNESTDSDVITVEELRSVSTTKFQLNIGDGKRKLTLPQVVAVQKRIALNKPRIFTPNIQPERNKRHASPNKSPISKKRKSGTDCNQGSVTADPELPWIPGEEGELEDRAFPSTWTPSMKEFYGALKTNSISLEDVWRKQKGDHLLWMTREDLERLGMGLRNGSKNKRIKCTYCKEFGDHFSSDCPKRTVDPVCLMCGEKRHTTKPMYKVSHKKKTTHVEIGPAITRCPAAMCLNCGKPVASKKVFLQCCGQCFPRSGQPSQWCRVCDVRHKTEDCPDNWRKYHLTTTTEQLPANKAKATVQSVKYKASHSQYCSNCAKKGHNYYECGAVRNLNKQYQPNSPVIMRPPEPETLVPKLTPTASIAQGDRLPPLQKRGELNGSQRSTAVDPPNAQYSSSSLPWSLDKRPSGMDNSATQKARNDNVRDSLSRNTVPSAGTSSSRTNEDVQKANTQTKTVFSQSQTSVPAPSFREIGCEISDAMSASTSVETSGVSPVTVIYDRSSSLKQIISDTREKDTRNRIDATCKSRTNERNPTGSNKDQRRKSRWDNAAPELDTSFSSGDSRSGSDRDKVKYKCKMIPDCSNYESLHCCKISMSAKEHIQVCRLADSDGLVEKLRDMFAEYDVSISLLRKKPEFHVGGDQYYRARDRVYQLVNDLRGNPRISIDDLLREPDQSQESVLPQAKSPSPEIVEVPVVKSPRKPVDVITIDDDDDSTVPEPTIASSNTTVPTAVVRPSQTTEGSGNALASIFCKPSSDSASVSNEIAATGQVDTRTSHTTTDPRTSTDATSSASVISNKEVSEYGTGQLPQPDSRSISHLSTDNTSNLDNTKVNNSTRTPLLSDKNGSKQAQKNVKPKEALYDRLPRRHVSQHQTFSYAARYPVSSSNNQQNPNSFSENYDFSDSGSNMTWSGNQGRGLYMDFSRPPISPPNSFPNQSLLGAPPYQNIWYNNMNYNQGYGPLYNHQSGYPVPQQFQANLPHYQVNTFSQYERGFQNNYRGHARGRSRGRNSRFSY